MFSIFLKRRKSLLKAEFNTGLFTWLTYFRNIPFKKEIVAVKEFRKYLGSYVNGFRNAKEWRNRLMQCKDESSFVRCMKEIQLLESPLALAG